MYSPDLTLPLTWTKATDLIDLWCNGTVKITSVTLKVAFNLKNVDIREEKNLSEK